MTVPAMGFVCLHERDYTAPDVATALVRFLREPAWGVALRHYASIATPGSRMPRRPGALRVAERDDVFTAMIADPANREVSMASESLTRSTDARAELSVARPGVWERFRVVRGFKPIQDAPSDQAWVDAAVVLFAALSAGTGIVVAADNLAVVSETSSVGIMWQGRLHHPWPEEFERMGGLAGREVGASYMRFPRWGTLVSHDHVAALGGAQAITSAVEPAVVRPLSGGTYFQLTASVATAQSDEAMAKQRAFTELAAPLLPPPVTPPG